MNDKYEIFKRVEKMRLLRVYEVEGRLGIATDTFMPAGRLVEKSTYGRQTHRLEVEASE